MDVPADTFAIAVLEAAINRARAAQPARGAEGTLSDDVATLASLYGESIYLRRSLLRWQDLSDDQRAALQRWAVPGPG